MFSQQVAVSRKWCERERAIVTSVTIICLLLNYVVNNDLECHLKTISAVLQVSSVSGQNLQFIYFICHILDHSRPISSNVCHIPYNVLWLSDLRRSWQSLQTSLKYLKTIWQPFFSHVILVLNCFPKLGQLPILEPLTQIILGYRN